MDHERHNRSLCIGSYKTRCIQEKEIHEFMMCEQSTDISVPINYIAYLGFGEFALGGVIEVGDLLYSGEKLIGEIVGFDNTHFPNHYNIVVQGNNCVTGAACHLSLNSVFSIQKSDS